jgi:hydrogenase nickel incorporation protein HypB
MIADLRRLWPIAVIAAGPQTTDDADRILAAGAEAVQIDIGETGRLDAYSVGHALDALPLGAGGLLFIETLGDPAFGPALDLGETHRIVVLSVTEGEDRPLTHPDLFAAADLVVINEIDLLPDLDFEMSACLAAVRRVNPLADVLTVSARTGGGLQGLYAWIESAARVTETGRR